MAKVLQNFKIIIWDECTMARKRALEALDRTFRDLHSNLILFGGGMILLAGDFCKTLPVIPRAKAADGINSCLKQSILWRYLKSQVNNEHASGVTKWHISGSFLKAITRHWQGKIPVDPSTGLTSFPPIFFCQFASIEELISKMFPNIDANYKIHFSGEK